MSQIRFWNNKILFNTDKIAMHEDCCCESLCCMGVTFSSNGCLTGPFNLPKISATLWRCLAHDVLFSANPQWITVELTESGGTYTVTVSVDGHIWAEDYGEDPVPCTFSGESITHISSGSCDTSAVTCTLTALSSGCPDCGELPCSQCDTGYAPEQIEITVSGVIDNNCDGCAGFNDVFPRFITLAPGNNTCEYSGDIFGGMTCWASSPYTLQVSAATYYVFGDAYLYVTLTVRYTTTIVTVMVFGELLSEISSDCENWTDENIPYLSTYGSVPNTCDATGATVTVSTI